jgi:hypothetical protein
MKLFRDMGFKVKDESESIVGLGFEEQTIEMDFVGMQKWILTTPQSGAICINEGSNDATIKQNTSDP